MVDFLVRRDDPRRYRVDAGEAARADVPEGSVQFTVERFGLTANNLTYAVLGDRLGYWDFFPAPTGWGRIPVWGFGRVDASGVEGVAAGERFYGYWPMSSRVTLPVEPDAAGLVASAPGRAFLPAVYNRYLRAMAETGFRPEHDDAAVVLRPLFLTGWLIADRLAADGWHGAGAVVLTSASSKTAFCTASAVREHDERPSLIGLTSTARVAFTTGLGLYDQVLTYGDVGALPTDRGIVLVDMAGDADIRAAVHRATRDVLHASIMVGATHWASASLDSGGLPGPEPVLFLAPTVAGERAAALGPAAFARRIGGAWVDFAARAPELIEFEHATGADALATAFTALLGGDVDPRKGLVFTL
ncbi:MAG TPA: DUF2855 family protein [Pseudonocardia sp.]|nr:DUF2855 family protein [Pseudonocardia sp.]